MLVEPAAPTLIDTDAIARRLTLPGGAAIAADRAPRFGADFIDADGALDRAAHARARPSPTPRAKRRLEAILHPLIGVEVERQAAARRGRAALVFDVPLLVESGRWRAPRRPRCWWSTAPRRRRSRA